MGKEYLNAFINSATTIRETAGEEMANARHKAVMYDTDGNVTLATAGDKAIGLVLSDCAADDNGTTPAGAAVDILIKDIGLLEASAKIVKGAAVTIDADGKGVTAVDGDYVFGYAMTAAAAAGEAIQLIITRSGITAVAADTDDTDA